MVDLFNWRNYFVLFVLLVIPFFFDLFSFAVGHSGVSRAWNLLKEDAREGAYESVCLRMKDAEREIVRLKGVVAVQRSKRERAEAVVDGLAAWVVKLPDLLKGEFVFLRLLDCMRSFPCVVSDLCSSLRSAGWAI